MNFYNEYAITEKSTNKSTISHITESQIPIDTGIYNNGLISILDIDVTVGIMKSWEWRFQKYFIPIISTAFGDLFLYSPRSENCYFFQPQYNTLELITDNLDELLNSALVNSGIKEGVLFESKFNEVFHTVGVLKYAEAYILKQWILLGGNDNIENYSIGNLNVYLDLVSKAQNK